MQRPVIHAVLSDRSCRCCDRRLWWVAAGDDLIVLICGVCDLMDAAHAAAVNARRQEGYR